MTSTDKFRLLRSSNGFWTISNSGWPGNRAMPRVMIGTWPWRWRCAACSYLTGTAAPTRACQIMTASLPIYPRSFCWDRICTTTFSVWESIRRLSARSLSWARIFRT